MAKDIPLQIRELERLKEINRVMKSHCTIWETNGKQIYMKSILPFVEKRATLIDPLLFYQNIIINPIQVASWLTHYRKTMTQVTERDDAICLYNMKTTESIFIQRVSENGLTLEQLKSFYRKLYVNPSFHQSVEANSDGEYDEIPREGIEAMLSKEIYTHTMPDGGQLLLSKTLFGELKKTERILVKEIPQLHQERYNKHYVFFLQKEPSMWIETIGAFLY